MVFVIDTSMAAAWLWPEEYSEAAEAVIATIEAPRPVPSLFFFEIRNILAMSEHRGRRRPSPPLACHPSRPDQDHQRQAG